MRKFALAAAVLLISAAAQLPASAEGNRGLTVLASSDTAPARLTVAQQLSTETPASAPRAETSQAETPAAPAEPKLTPRPALKAEAAESAKAAEAPEAKAKPAAPKPAVKRVRRETDEQKARRIAARYGVYW